LHEAGLRLHWIVLQLLLSCMSALQTYKHHTLSLISKQHLSMTSKVQRCTTTQRNARFASRRFPRRAPRRFHIFRNSNLTASPLSGVARSENPVRRVMQLFSWLAFWRFTLRPRATIRTISCADPDLLESGAVVGATAITADRHSTAHGSSLLRPGLAGINGLRASIVASI
jgi:hypothetical protein